MARIIVPDAEKILDHEFPVLNKGFVRLVDYMGGDARIVQSARVSYGEGTKTVREDAALIDYLMRNDHTSPFEQVVLTFHIKAPIFVARQWVRHRTARMNEISGRYSVMTDEFYVPHPGDVRHQSKANKQGRSSTVLASNASEQFLQSVTQEQQVAYENYCKYINGDISRELARLNLPLSLYTQFYWQIDLHNLFHFLKLRLDDHAQLEIRVYGEVLAECAKNVAPMAFQAFEQHVLNGTKFSKEEWIQLEEHLRNHPLPETFSPSLRQKITTQGNKR